VIDLSAINADAGSLSKINISGNGGNGDLLFVNAAAVSKLGSTDLVTDNGIIGTGHHQLVIQGDANDHLTFTDTAGQWHDEGTTVVNNVNVHVYENGDLQVLIVGTEAPVVNI
jgi:hypothetical protein